jgi:hypothetical protein
VSVRPWRGPWGARPGADGRRKRARTSAGSAGTGRRPPGVAARGAQEEGGAATAGAAERRDRAAIPDCSVLVSPDGALLFTARSAARDRDRAGPGHAPGEGRPDEGEGDPTRPADGDRYPWTAILAEDRDGVVLGEDYASAVVCGDDLVGDAVANGFSARGWSHDAATLALGASRDFLTGLEAFAEERALGGKEAAERLGGCREGLRAAADRPRGGRAGPMLAPGATLAAAAEAMEEYYARSAEGNLERWRSACSERGPAPSQTVAIEMKELDSCGKEVADQKSEAEQQRQRDEQEAGMIQGLLQ